MSQYQQTPGQREYLKKKYAEEAEDTKDLHTWDTPYDKPMTIAEARAAAQKERDKWKNRIPTEPNDINSPSA